MNIFMGTFLEVLEVFDRVIGTDLVIIEDKQSSEGVLRWCREYRKEVRVVKTKSEVQSLVPHNSQLAVVAGFGIILSSEIINKCTNIINFHPGLVQQCRGRHPLPVSVLKRYPTMGITCHIINDEEIDAGPIIAQISIPIDYDKSYKSNEDKLKRYLRKLAEAVFEEYKETKTFISVQWKPKREAYFKPLPPLLLNKIINAEKLSDISVEEKTCESP